MTVAPEVRYWWHEAPVPAGLEITQVYGYLLCPWTCRVLVQDDDGVFNLPGGTPEPEDADLAATLVREAFEENQVCVGATAYPATRRCTALAVPRTRRCGWRG
jgi:8-oxo-dGTP diphosphatase